MLGALSRCPLRLAAAVVAEARAGIHHHRELDTGSPERFHGYGRWSRKRKANRHRNEDFREQRHRKFVEIDLPDMDVERRQARGELTTSDMKERLRKEGMPMPRSWARERPFHISDSGSIFDDYIPPEGDARASFLSDPIKKSLELRDKHWTHRDKKSVKRLKEKVPAWTEEDFAPQAQDLYVQAHRLLADNDVHALHDYITDFCYPSVVNELKLRSLVWEWVESLEAPKVVQVRCQNLLDDTNTYCQVTVRLHSLQKLAVYDQWGRLMLGSPDIPQKVVEYVVLENHIVDPNGAWRIHGKIRPNWNPESANRQPRLATFRKEELGEAHEVPEETRKRHQTRWRDLKDEEESPLIDSVLKK